MINFDFPVRKRDRECYDCFGVNTTEVCERLCDMGMCYLENQEEEDDENSKNN